MILYQLNRQIPIRLPTARAHLQPITDFPLHLSQRFVSRSASDTNRSNVRTGVLRGPKALFLRHTANELHALTIAESIGLSNAPKHVTCCPRIAGISTVRPLIWFQGAGAVTMRALCNRKDRIEHWKDEAWK